MIDEKKLLPQVDPEVIAGLRPQRRRQPLFGWNPPVCNRDACQVECEYWSPAGYYQIYRFYHEGTPSPLYHYNPANREGAPLLRFSNTVQSFCNECHETWLDSIPLEF